MAEAMELVPRGTEVTASGDGAAVDISASATRTFIVTLNITDTIEQQSIDLWVHGSEDGQNFSPKALLKLPQRFYRGETRLVLDLSQRPEIKAIRAHWDLNRWGRVAPTPRFIIGVTLEEVPAFPKRAPAPAAASA